MSGDLVLTLNLAHILDSKTEPESNIFVLVRSHTFDLALASPFLIENRSF